MSKVRAIQASEFAGASRRSVQPLVVEFHASWCPPCKLLTPALEKLAEEFDGRIDFVKIDAEEACDLANQFGVESVPTVIVLKQGEVAGRKVGFSSKEDLRSMLTHVLGAPV
jgi:thioredoxin